MAAPKTIDAKGKPPKSRIPDATKARELFDKVWAADELSALNRTSVQRQIDGHPPFNSAELKRMGLGSSSNLNFGEAQADMDRAIAAFNDMVTSQERSAFVFLSDDYATDSLRQDYEDKIAIAFHKVNGEWDERYYEEQMLSWYYNRDGVGIYLWANERDPRWRAESLDGFKIPRGTKATENKIEYAYARHPFMAHELYDYIKDAETATKAGWNVPAARTAIQEACNETSEEEKWDWERVEIMLKNNDYYSTSARASLIHAWDCFVKEFDGTYSHHILLRGGDENYLFSKIGRYRKATEAFIVSTYGIGTNGCYHGIRGLAYRIFPFVEHSNRIRNKIIDGAMASTALMFEAEDAKSAQQAGMAYIGPYAILPAGLKPVNVTLPNPSLTALPVVADLAKTRLANTGGFMTPGGGTVERKELEIQQEMANQAVLPASAVNLFMIGRQKMMKEQLRRLSLTVWAPTEGGADMAKRFQALLKEMNVPLEALKHVENVVPARALGAGSPSARQLAFQQLMPVMGQFDEIGRNNFIRDWVGQFVGFDQVGRYVPQLANRQRPVADEGIAYIQNGELRQGFQLPVLDGEDDAVHLKVHLRALVTAAHAVLNGGDMMGTIQFFGTGIPHAEQHMARMAQDPSRKPMVDSVQSVFQGLNLLGKQLAQLVEKQGAGGAPGAAGAGGAGGAPQIPPEVQAKILATKAQIALATQEMQAKMNIKNQEAMQRMQIRDAHAAQTIQLRNASQLQETQ